MLQASISCMIRFPIMHLKDRARYERICGYLLQVGARNPSKLRKAANAGDTDASFLYGVHVFVYGEDVRTAEQYLTAAKEAGCEPARCTLAQIDGRWVNGQRLDLYEGLARERTGFKGKRAKDKLREAFEPTAESAEDLIALAHLYICERYGEPDPRKAEDCLRKAAESGSAEAKYILAVRLKESDETLFGYTPAKKESDSLLLESANEGFVPAAVDYLSRELKFSNGDHRELMELVKESGDPHYKELLFLERTGGWSEDREEYKKLADEGCIGCCRDAASLLMPNDERDIPKGKRDEAIYYLRKGALGGDLDSALMYTVAANRGKLFDMDACDVILWFVASHAQKGSKRYLWSVVRELDRVPFDIPESLYG